jgi:D-alanine-D-alanine ligase
MDVGIIYSLVDDSLKGGELDRLADDEVLDTAQAVRVALERNGHRVGIHNICRDGLAVLAQYDTLFNLAESTVGSEVTEDVIAEKLEEMGLIFTGAGSAGLRKCANKAWTKALLVSQDIPTPPYQVVRGEGETVTGLKYPLIVKPVGEDGSTGIDDDSVVWDERRLEQKIAQVLRVYKQPALVEEYIDGREINAALIGNGEDVRVLPLSEIIFPPDEGRPHILSFACEWVAGSYAYENTASCCPADLDARTEETIKAIALRACRVTGCNDYARVDIRLRGDTPYVLEVNPNPCINPQDSGFMASAATAGFSYDQVVNEILACAVARAGVLQRPRAAADRGGRLSRLDGVHRLDCATVRLPVHALRPPPRFGPVEEAFGPLSGGKVGEDDRRDGQQGRQGQRHEA